MTLEIQLAPISFVAVLAILFNNSITRYHWRRAHTQLESSDAASNVANGVAANHPFAARHEAARKLITNHAAVVRDITRSDGPPATQPKLERLPGQEKAVDRALCEVTNRLLGHRRGSYKWWGGKTNKVDEK